MTDAASLVTKVLECTLCSADFSHSPNPILQFNPRARVLIASQAPGSIAHKSGVPFQDPSGIRLRDWMGIDEATFYDDRNIAIVPMAFCYPGKGAFGDLPPPEICAKTWRARLLQRLQNIQLTLLIGQHAQAWHVKSKRTLTETVRARHDFGDRIFPLPHPSPRNNIWLRKNPWFEDDVVPELRTRVASALSP